MRHGDFLTRLEDKLAAAYADLDKDFPGLCESFEASEKCKGFFKLLRERKAELQELLNQLSVASVESTFDDLFSESYNVSDGGLLFLEDHPVPLLKVDFQAEVEHKLARLEEICQRFRDAYHSDLLAFNRLVEEFDLDAVLAEVSVDKPPSDVPKPDEAAGAGAGIGDFNFFNGSDVLDESGSPEGAPGYVKTGKRPRF